MIEYVGGLLEAFPVTVYFFVVCFGLIVGSFLNVVILRLPVMMQRDWQSQAREILELASEPEGETFNLMTPNSTCPSCGRKIKPWENVPIISYLFLRGRCAGCGGAISIRYPLIEALMALLTVIVVAKFGLTPTALVCLLLTFGLIAASVIDYDHQLLPDSITLPLLWLGLIANYFELLVPFEHAFWGAVAGYLVLWAVYQAFKLITRKEGMGFGDFKLLAMLGAFTGWQMLPLIIILSSFAGAVIGSALILFGRDRAKPIPFGPYLAIAGFIALIWGESILSGYLQFAAL